MNKLTDFYDEKFKNIIENILKENKHVMTWEDICNQIPDKNKCTYVHVVNCTGDNCLEGELFFEICGKPTFIGLREWIRKSKPFPMITGIKVTK